MVNPQKIKYNGVFSDSGFGSLDIILDVSFDSDDGATSTYLNRSAVFAESYDGRYKNTARYKYDELFSPQFTIVKKDFSEFTQDEVRQVLKYLTMTDRPALLEAYYDGESNVVDWACIGGWTSIETYKLSNSRIVGIVATFEAITPFAMSDLYTITKRVISVDDNKVVINIDTDDNKPVYPRVTINHGYDNTPHTVIRVPDGVVYTRTSNMVPNTVYFNGTTYYWKESDSTDASEFHLSDINPALSTTSVKFTNTCVDFFNQEKVLPSVVVKNNNSTEKIVLDGANKIITSSSVNRIFGDDFVNWQWLELHDGTNEIVIEGNCEVTFEWRTVIKCGSY